MTQPSRAGSAQAAKPIRLPAGLVDAARLKAKASGLALDDYVRALVAADGGVRVSRNAARKAARR